VPGGNPSESSVVDLKEFIVGTRIRSVTGEIVYDSKAASCRIDSPKAQGVAAFFDPSTAYEFADVTLRAAHEYGTVLVVSMDDLPIRESGRVLVQVGTRSRPAGWQERPRDNGAEVVSFGAAPWRVARADLSVAIRNPSLGKATALDANGLAIADVPLEAKSDGVEFRFPEGTMHVVLQ
jgi:hypothetical protein